MADKDKSGQFIDELRKAAEQGNLPRDIFDFAQTAFTVGGDVTGSNIVTGIGNVVTIYQQPPAPVEKEDEQLLVVESLAAYRDELKAELATASEDPYPGLLAYRLQDASHFFGRKQAVADVMAELERKRLIWLHGRSGTGKSSLIQAGLMPALLEKGALPILVRSFDESPTLALKKTLLKRRWSGDLELGAESLLQFLSRLDAALHGQQICIFFDQFEEFADKLPEVKQVEFALELADCLADKSLPARFIFSLQSDRFGETTVLRERLQPGEGREYRVRPLSPVEAREVIVGPVERFGITYQDGLVDAILQHLETTEVDSPQLQLVCERLFHTLPEHSRQITFEHYQRLGEAKGIINDYLKQVLHDRQAIPSSQFKAATYILSTLVTLDGKRDVKQAEDWYVDERLRILTFDWRTEPTSSPVPDGALAMQSMRPIAVADFVEQVRKHVSIQGEELRQIVNDMLNGYVRKAQKSFVDDVLRSLRDARLLHEIESDDGGMSYELVHEYLVAEIKGWLDEDEQKARQLRNRLNQIQLDFNKHKLLLEPKELEIIRSQLGNPKLTLQESDKRLLLLSAAAHGSGRQWLEVSGLNGPDWLREACLDETFPESVRLGAAALLGEVGDKEAFQQLYNGIESGNARPQKSLFLDMLSHFLHHTSQPHPLPPRLAWPVFRRQARLRVKEGSEIRSRMRKAASYTAPICVIIMMTSVMAQVIMYPVVDTPPLPVYTFIAIFVCILGYFAAYFFAEITTSLTLIMRSWAWIWQVMILGSVGSLLGIIFLYILSGQKAVWFEGGIISLTMVLINRGPSLKAGWYSVMIALTSGVLISLLSQLVIEDTALETFGAALSIGVFAGVYAYFASRRE